MQPSSHSWKWIHCNLIYQVHCILPFLAVNTGIYCWVLCRFFVIFLFDNFVISLSTVGSFFCFLLYSRYRLLCHHRYDPHMQGDHM